MTQLNNRLVGGGNFTPSNRESHVDIIKGWAMLTIVIFHSSSGLFTGQYMQLMGNPWNVAVFFIVAGFFLNIDKMSQPVPFVLKKAKTLYVPATIIYLLAVLLHNVFVRIGWYPLGEIHPFNGRPFQLYGIKDIAFGCAKVICCCGSGELIMGAMWFLYALIYSFVALTVLWWVANKIIPIVCKRKDSVHDSSFNLMSLLLLLLAIASCVLTQNYGITISRFSTAVTAMFLIWVGMIINKRLCWTYDNKWMFLGSLLIFIQCILLGKVSVKMANNQYQDILQIVIGSSSLIYIWGYIGKRISKTFVGRFLALVGRESLYVMALHILGFFMCDSLLKSMDVFTSDSSHGLYTYKMNGNVLLFLLYMAFAIGVPLLVIKVFRLIMGMFYVRR